MTSYKTDERQETKCRWRAGSLPDPISIHPVLLRSACPFFLILSLQNKKLSSHKGREPQLRVSTQFHTLVTKHTLKGSINPWPCIGSSREDLLSLQPAKLRNALQHLIHARSHSPDSLCCHQTAYSFLHRFVVCTLSPFGRCVKGFFIFGWSLGKRWLNRRVSFYKNFYA